MGLPQVIRSRQMMRHDGGDPLKSQDHHAGLRALPLKAMECGKFEVERYAHTAQKYPRNLCASSVIPPWTSQVLLHVSGERACHAARCAQRPRDTLRCVTHQRMMPEGTCRVTRLAPWSMALRPRSHDGCAAPWGTQVGRGGEDGHTEGASAVR